MSFPSTFSAFVYVNPSQRISSPSHSSVHNLTSSSLGQVETILGLSGDNSVLGTVIGDLYSPGSGGGGHIQTAVLGGTGQKIYSKGDVLVATNSSTLAKLAVGSDGQYLQANSSAAAGVQWSGGSNRLFIQGSTITANSSETSIYSVSIPASILANITLNAVRMTSNIENWTTRANDLNIFRFQLGGGNVGSVAVQVQGVDNVARGTIIHTIISSTATLQKHFIDVNGATSDKSTGSFENLIATPALVGGSVLNFRAITSTISSFSGGATLNMGFTIQSGANSAIKVGGVIIEKIN